MLFCAICSKRINMVRYFSVQFKHAAKCHVVCDNLIICQLFLENHNYHAVEFGLSYERFSLNNFMAIA